MSEEQAEVRLIKKYPNRRLYDTRTSTHITLTDIRQLVLDEEVFKVVDAKTSEDITRAILLQIIQEAERDGDPIFSAEMLQGIIRFYGPFQSMFGSYLDKSIQTVHDIQRQTGMQSPAAWNDFLESQMPMIQNLMRQYIEQAKSIYLSTQNMLGLFAPRPGDRKDDH